MIYFTDILPYFDNVIKKYGSLIHFKIIARHYIIINDPDDIKVRPLSLKNNFGTYIISSAQIPRLRIYRSR